MAKWKKIQSKNTKYQLHFNSHSGFYFTQFQNFNSISTSTRNRWIPMENSLNLLATKLWLFIESYNIVFKWENEGKDKKRRIGGIMCICHLMVALNKFVFRREMFSPEPKLKRNWASLLRMKKPNHIIIWEKGGNIEQKDYGLNILLLYVVVYLILLHISYA